MTAHPSVSLEAILGALRDEGWRPERRDAPLRWHSEPPRPALWTPMPGDDAYAVVTVVDLVPGAGPGSWRRAHRADPPARTAGYQVTFHERPFRTRGHPYADPAAQVFTVAAGHVVSTVREWGRWESTWSVPPAPAPARQRLGRLRRLAASRLASAGLAVDVDLDPLMLAWLDARQVDDVHRLCAELFLPGIRWRFPRDRHGGRPASRARVLLRECAPPAGPGAKGVWLVATGPEPRAEPQLTIRLERALGKSAAHRWDRFPEFWHTAGRDLDDLWDVRPGRPAAEVTAALDEGRLLDALLAAGVAVDRGTRRLLGGLPDCFSLREWTDRWVLNLADVLGRSAPWRWAAALRPGRRPQRLESLGGFNPNRRPGLFLHWQDGGPRLTFDQSASPLVLPRVDWERDADFDLVRFGLLTRGQIPLP